jgi:hypothetical protein
MVQPVDRISDDANHREDGDDDQADGQPERHQNELPMNGSMWPQNNTAVHTTIADAAATFAVNGASSPSFIPHGSSSNVK